MKDPRSAYPGKSLDPSLVDARASAYDRQAAAQAPSATSADSITADPDFQALPPASQRAVLAQLAPVAGRASVPAAAPVPSAPAASAAPASSAAHLETIRNDPDFQKLPPASQRAVLEHFGLSDEGKGFGSLTASPTPLSERAAGAVPAPLAGFVRGALERTADPAQRLYNRGIRGVTTMPGQTLADAAQLGTATAALPAMFAGAPEAAIALGAGTGVQGLAEAVGASPNTARILGAVAEPVAGVVAGNARVRAYENVGANVAREGTSLRRTPAAVAGETQTLPREALGGELQTQARTALRDLKGRIGGDIGNLEKRIAQSVPTMESSSPAYAKIAAEVSTLEEHGFAPPTSAGKPTVAAYERIRDAVLNHEPVATADVATLRRGLTPVLNRPFNPGAPNDPATAFLRVFRNKLGDALEATAPNENLAFAYANARDAYLAEVVKPSKVLRSVLSENTSPAQAYGKVFGMSAGNPNTRTFQTLAKTLGANENPALRVKLRAGFMERLAELTNDFADQRQSAAIFGAQRPTLAATGLFSEEELERIAFWLKRGELPALVDKVTTVIGHRLGPVGTGAAMGASGTTAILHAPAILSLAASHPVGLFAAALAGGGVKTIRVMNRLRHIPMGHSSNALIAADLIGGAGRMAAALRQGQHDGPSDEDGTVDH